MSDKKNKVTTKAGLMNKHKSEIEPVESENRATEDVEENESIDENLPRTSKHSVGKHTGHEGLH